MAEEKKEQKVNGVDQSRQTIDRGSPPAPKTNLPATKVLKAGLGDGQGTSSNKDKK